MASHPHERRRAPRVPCEIPVLLRCNGRSVETRSADLSRVGTRVRIPVAALGLPDGAPLTDLSREATKVLGERLILEFMPDLLGDLVRRSARPVRFAWNTKGQAYLEIGLDLRDPITDMEVEFLGLALPPIFEDLDAEDLPLPTAGGRDDLSVLLCSQGPTKAPPLSAVPTYLGAGGVQADLGRVRDLPILIDQPGAAGVMAALAEAYGGEPHTVLLIQNQPVWSGSVRLQAVDVRPADERILLEMAFSQPIPEGARARLGF